MTYGCVRVAALSLALVIFFAGRVEAKTTLAKTLEGPIPAQVTRVIDGDTIEVRALIWLGQEIIVRVRLAGVDAPELTAACEPARAAAEEARAFVVAQVDGARIVLTQIHGDKYFGRVVGRVQTPKGEDLSSLLLDAGHALPYSGGRRGAAC